MELKAIDSLCARCGGQKEPQRIGRYSYCLKCQYKFSLESNRRNPYRRFSEDKKIQNKCRYAVSQALKSGVLIKQPCQTCQEPKSEAHHEDYNKPLDVKWLCRKHHFEIHGRKPKVRAKKTTPVGYLQPHLAPVFHVEHSVIMSKIEELLAKETTTYEKWAKDIKPSLSITNQKRKQALFNKKIGAFKTTIHTISTFVVRKGKP